jgi:glycerate-2-kinase
MADLPVIKNIDELASTALRRDALKILEAGYESVLTDVVIREEIVVDGDTICMKDMRLCLTDYDRIFFVGIGKCAVDASLAVERILGERITDGIVLDVKEGVFSRMRSIIGTHPFPSETNVIATRAIVEMLSGLTERDLVLAVISGGGSSLLCLPHEMHHETLSNIVRALWEKGATIQEVNTVRKHTSDIQGGQLAKAAYPATVISFIFSDVPGNDIGMVASGPTVRDETTVEDAERILAKYDVLSMCKLPNCQLVETPKDERYFARVTNLLLVTNDRALEAMRLMAEVLGYHAEIRDRAMTGIAREKGSTFATMELPEKTCLLFGGETTVKITGDGKGGRNQELALSAARSILDGRVVVAASSDGWDNTDIAGAIADSSVRDLARSRGMLIDEYLARNDSYRFWRALGGGIRTGRTGINVADFCIVIRAV